MATLNECLDAAEQHLGFREPRARAIAKRLTEAGILPSGGPGRPPELDETDFVRLLIALAVNSQLRRSDEIVRVYSELAPHGARLQGAPNSVVETAFDQLAIIADIALHGDASLVRKVKIEFVSTWPEIAIHDYGATARFREVGANASHWNSGKHRTSTVINGAAFVDALEELFGE
ncbi:hypothetical protein [Bradyrhizobium glycinis]|uniref:hypothetical protein n=1 Tax=Bradyrhizobium glycinis TaxID=2751812 RepID=UPI0018D6C836|nr:hypothetical protein [Bradyrhizobium glycinis]MBH5371479.1 hypothetical protein [Bradyrhizobium glycinis]